MRGRWNLDSIAAAFAEAAVDPTRWTAAMEATAAETGSFGCALFPIRGRSPHIPFSGSLGESFEKYIGEGWISRDERYRTAPVIERKGVATDLDYIDADGIRRHPYYQEFLAPQGLAWFAGVKVAAGEDFFSLSIQRSSAEGMFEKQEQAKLANLSAKLGSAIAIAQAIGFARIDAAANAFELNGKAVVMLNRSGEVVRMTAAAERLLGEDLFVRNERMVSSSASVTSRLDQMLHRLLWRQSPSSLVPPVQIPRLGGGRPILAYCARLEGLSPDLVSPCQAIVVLIDLDEKIAISARHLSAAFGLTTAQAKVAAEIASGKKISEIAVSFGLSDYTVQSHLKSIFQRTGVTRQPELVALLCRLVGGDETPAI